MEPRAEWHGKADFSEVAEALGVTTERILAMLGDEHVLYTPEGTTDIWGARLGRDADGILIAGAHGFVSTEADFHARMDELVRKAMEED